MEEKTRVPNPQKKGAPTSEDMLKNYEMDPKIVVFGSLKSIRRQNVYADIFLLPLRYKKIVEKELKEVLISEKDFIRIVKSLTFVSNGIEVKTLSHEDPPWYVRYVYLTPMADQTIATEFLPFVPKWGVVASPLSSESFIPPSKFGPLQEAVYEFLHPIYSYSHILVEIKEAALCYFEEKTGIKRGKSYREIIKTVKAMTIETMIKENIKPFLKYKDRVFLNTLIPNHVFSIFSLKKTLEKKGIPKNIPKDVEDQIALLESLLDPPLKQGGDRNEFR